MFVGLKFIVPMNWFGIYIITYIPHIHTYIHTYIHKYLSTINIGIIGALNHLIYIHIL